MCMLSMQDNEPLRVGCECRTRCEHWRWCPLVQSELGPEGMQEMLAGQSRAERRESVTQQLHVFSRAPGATAERALELWDAILGRSYERDPGMFARYQVSRALTEEEHDAAVCAAEEWLSARGK